jgi:hypothetical protein
MDKRWGGLKPDQVAKIINFEEGNAKWDYVVDAAPTMASRQTEGVARLWNLLSQHRVALLADEVGTGKTFQALGVATLLWRMKPDARILLMTPNRDICHHWEIEFATFVDAHYRHADDRVKSKADGKPIPQTESHYQLRGLADALESRSAKPHPPQLYVTTIHSLSGLVGDANVSKKNEAAKHAAQELYQRMMTALDGEGFDLIIVDEAHYFRNTDGGSQRAAAAGAFFGSPKHRLGQRMLVLTATPSHTHLSDVASVLSYFTELGENGRSRRPDELMEKFALRRFRIMNGADGGHTKHRYRREIATPCDFTGRPEAEAFFALYQHKLVHDLKLFSEKRRVLYGFLEGFESSGPDKKMQVEQICSVELTDNERSENFTTADDTRLLHEMSKDYRDAFRCAPDHPKYGGLVDQCAPPDLFGACTDVPLHEDKHLVFVRRIPSVRELTKRINEKYDEVLARQICSAWDLQSADPEVRRWMKILSRDGFEELIRKRKAAHPDAGADDAGDDDLDTDGDANVDGEPGEGPVHDAYLGSKIAELFVTKKIKGKPAPAPTDCSRFSLSLRRSTSIHAMFMEPASDYMAGGYRNYVEFRQGDKARADYTKMARAERLTKHGLITGIDSEQTLPSDAKAHLYDNGLEIETLWSVVFPHLAAEQQATLRRWAATAPKVAENFGNYIQAGFLFASPVIIELYCWHTCFQRALPFGKQHTDVQRRYRAFISYVRERIAGSLLLKYFGAALDSFEQLCRKIVKHDADDWKTGWRSLTTLSSPAWFASGESSHRQHLILGFNSPFYPNTLVATSVFQEGINLHLQCRKVHHYGIAWTPGDNEQRVGRIDRLFGKVNQLIHKQPAGTGTATLVIDYPYLKNSFDEDQVGSFIERKHAVEEKIDRCVQKTFDKTVQLTRPGWEDFLRQPNTESAPGDPYPARFGVGDVPVLGYPGLLVL